MFMWQRVCSHVSSSFCCVRRLKTGGFVDLSCCWRGTSSWCVWSSCGFSAVGWNGWRMKCQKEVLCGKQQRLVSIAYLVSFREVSSTIPPGASQEGSLAARAGVEELSFSTPTSSLCSQEEESPSISNCTSSDYLSSSDCFPFTSQILSKLTLETIKKECSPQEVENLFYTSVVNRTVSNAQLKRFLSCLAPGQHAQALAAVQGAKRGGLRLNAITFETLVEHLISSGQLKAALALYQEMLRTRLIPTPRTYSLLMDLCLEQGLPLSCENLFYDMSRKGIRPSIHNYELLLSAYAVYNPPQWEKAIALFDKVSTQRYLRASAKTYSALMRVYLNMRPFDWRVVYNCYYELRHHDPPIRLDWESYELVREALIKGNAGWFRRLSTYCDAWITITPMFTVQWMKGVMVYIVIMIAFKSIVCSIFSAFLTSATPREGTTDAMFG